MSERRHLQSGPVYVGIDLGSSRTKVAVLDANGCHALTAGCYLDIIGEFTE